MSSTTTPVSAPSDNTEDKNSKEEQRIEQYKTYLDMLNHSNEQRIATNQFFVAINVSLVTFLATILEHMFDSDSGNVSVLLLLLPLPALTGYCLSRLWCFLLISYNTVNSSRWNVVYDMEKTLPYQPFQSEWEKMEPYETNIPKGFLWLQQVSGISPKRYYSISGTERKLPILFGGLYLIIIVTVSVYVVWSLLIEAYYWISLKWNDIILFIENIKSLNLEWVIVIIGLIVIVFTVIALRWLIHMLKSLIQ